eukprot:2830448-Ditylum_brightwellii.AAC.1
MMMLQSHLFLAVVFLESPIEGYDLLIYLCFDGDIVLNVNALENIKEAVEEYVWSVENILLYTCLDGEGKEMHEAKGGICHFQINDFYGLHYVNKPIKHPISEPSSYNTIRAILAIGNTVGKSAQ